MVKISNSFARQFSSGNILTPHLENWFATAKFPDVINLQIKPNKEKDDAFHPSSALECARVLYAKRRDEMPFNKPSPDAQKTFMLGHFFHAIIQYALVDMNFVDPVDVEKEYDIQFHAHGMRIRGFTDIARCHIPGQKEPYLVDIKSMMSRQFAKPEISESLLEKYTAQVRLYLDMEGLDKAIILFAEKDTPHRFKEHLVKADGHAIDTILARWMKVVEADAVGIPPECSCSNPSNCPAKGLY